MRVTAHERGRSVVKLATRRNGQPDGRLVVVSRDLSSMVEAGGIALTLQEAVENWRNAQPELERLYANLNDGKLAHTEPYDARTLTAPLPRAWQWLDASAFPSHGELMQKAFNLPPIATTPPLMYQGMSHTFLGPTDDVPLPSEADGIDFEGEFGIITGSVPMGTSSADAPGHIRLAVQINDWSLRAHAAAEMKTGFGWIHAKPACSVAPVAVTLDELGNHWEKSRITARLRVEVNGKMFGDVPATEMQFGFHELIAHAARSRALCAGTVIGSGTVSSKDCRETGSCCIAERRAIETIDHGAPRTEFLRFNDRVRMSTRLGTEMHSPFGVIDQRVIRPR
jgi:fumarylacetoacetate (FAA) hydrolase